MILSDGDIRRRIEVGDIVIDPLDDPELQIQPASVDLRLGRKFLTFDRSNIQCIHPDKGYDVDNYVNETTLPGSSRNGQQTLREFDPSPHEDGERIQEEFVLHPGDFVLGTTKERVAIPDDLIAHVEGRSSLGRLAIVVHASLPADEEIFLWTPTDGFGLYRIGEVVESEQPAFAVSFDPQTLRVDTHRVTDYITNPTQRIHRVMLESGRHVHVTADHNLFTIDERGRVTRIPSEEAGGTHVMVPGELPASPSEKTELDLVDLFADDDDIVAYATDGFGTIERGELDGGSERQAPARNATPIPRLRPAARRSITEVAARRSDTRLPRTFELTPELGWVLGFYVAAGAARREGLRFVTGTRAFSDRLAEWFEQFDIGTETDTNADGVHRLTVSSRVGVKLFGELVGVGRAKTIPDDAWNWPEPVLRALLEGLLDGDGTKEGGTIHPSSASLASRAMYLASRLGLQSAVYSPERETERDPHGVRDDYAVDIQEELLEGGQYVPNPHVLLREMRDAAGLTRETVAHALGMDGKTSISALERGECDGVRRDTLRELATMYGERGVDTTRLRQLQDGDLRFERVVSVEETDRIEPTYDLEVQPNGRTIENFLGGHGGVFLSNTAGLCDPGFEGKITLELSNLGTAPVALTPDMRIAQLTFTELTSPAERPYGADRGSKYQGQTGPQASRIQHDHEFGGDQR